MSFAFRSYDPADRQACLDIFAANCPEFFLPNEQADFEAYLDGSSDGYEVAIRDGVICGAFGLYARDASTRTLCWIMLHPETQGGGLGTLIMHRVIAACRAGDVSILTIAASHKSAPFFARFGARSLRTIDDGWGPGMHRVDMELPIEGRRAPAADRQ